MVAGVGAVAAVPIALTAVGFTSAGKINLFFLFANSLFLSTF